MVGSQLQYTSVAFQDSQKQKTASEDFELTKLQYEKRDRKVIR